MPLSILYVAGTGVTGATIPIIYKFTGDAMLLSAEAYNLTSPCEIALYLRNAGSVQCCALPESHHGPQQKLSEDIKIPVTGQQELVADFKGSTTGDVLELHLMFYVKDGAPSTQRMGWWQ